MRSILAAALLASVLAACAMPPDSTDTGAQSVASDTASTAPASAAPAATPTPAPTASPIKFSGTGNSGLQGPFYLNAGVHSFTGSMTGSGNFSVWLADSSGQDQDLIFNSTGAYSGTVKKSVPADGKYYLDVQFADGAWTASVN